jgi:ribose transport system ATP-binding protein
LEARNLAAGPLRGIDLKVCGGEIVGLAGLLGSGRSTVLRALFGITPMESGSIRLDGSKVAIRHPRDAMAIGMAYVPEDREKDAAFPQLTVSENLSVTVTPDYWERALLRRGRERRDTQELLQKYQVQAPSPFAEMRTLSGGNQQKLVLARWLRTDPRLLLLDEPTQGVDVGARAQIYDLVHRAVSEGAAALLASSDFEELSRLCDRVLVLQRGTVIAEAEADALNPDRLARMANAEVTTA